MNSQGALTERAPWGGVFASVPDLVAAIDEYVAHHNTNAKPSSGPRALATSGRKSSVLTAAYVQNSMQHYTGRCRRARSTLPASPPEGFAGKRVWLSYTLNRHEVSYGTPDSVIFCPYRLYTTG